MNTYGGGLITILLYGLGGIAAENGVILTELGSDVLSEAAQPLLVETV